MQVLKRKFKVLFTHRERMFSQNRVFWGQSDNSSVRCGETSGKCFRVLKRKESINWPSPKYILYILIMSLKTRTCLRCNLFAIAIRVFDVAIIYNLMSYYIYMELKFWGSAWTL